MPLYRITPKARESLKNIGLYTDKQWGKEQRNAYLYAIDKRFQWLANNPTLGKHRKDIEEGYYCYKQGQHLIFYMVFPEHIAIIGVPHRAMDILEYFGLN